MTKLKKFWGYFKRHKNIKRILCAFIFLIILSAVFEIGINIGNGNIDFNQVATTGLPAKLDYTSVNQLYNVLRENYDGHLTETQILNGIKHGMVNALNDPYSEYFTANEAQQFNNQLNNSFSGIGAELNLDNSGDVQVIAPVAGTPAAQAGLQPKDIITSINNVSTSGMSIETAVNDIRGPANTKVTLGILRGNQSLTIVITRQNITIPSVNSKILTGNIGYMQINSFSNDTSSLAQSVAQKFKNAKVKGIVLDLRNNPGGLLTAAINVSSLWLPEGSTILQEKTGNTVIQSYSALGGDILNGIPTVVLINGGSASSSEITTGALHDNNAAYVIGQQSYGKGVVQQLINLSGGAEIKVTVASWYRPNGQDINKKGITPDQVINPTAQDVANGTDVQLNAALNYLAMH